MAILALGHIFINLHFTMLRLCKLKSKKGPKQVEEYRETEGGAKPFLVFRASG